MSDEIVVNTRTRGLMTMLIIIVTVLTAGTAARVATGVNAFLGAPTIVSTIRGVGIIRG